MLTLYKVTGNSMSPSFNDGDYVCALKKIKKLKVQQVVLVNHHAYGLIIKRIKKINIHGQLTLSGDNPHQGVSSEDIGTIEPAQVRAKVLFKIAR